MMQGHSPLVQRLRQRVRGCQNVSDRSAGRASRLVKSAKPKLLPSLLTAGLSLGLSTFIPYAHAEYADSLTNGLLMQYKFNGTGSVVIDTGSQDNDGTLTNASYDVLDIPYAQQSNASSVDFNGSQHRVVSNADIDTSVQGANDKSICGWIKSRTSNVANAQVMFAFGGDSLAAAFGFYTSSTDEIQFWGAGNVNDLGTGINISAQWQHLCATYDGTTLQTYVDGVARTNAPKSLNTPAGPLSVGKSPGNNFSFNGNVDDVRVYDRVLSPSEVQLIFDAPNPGGVNNATLWLDASDNIERTNSSVTGWLDQSSSGLDVSQGTATAQPTYNNVTNLLNFNPTLSFDASSSDHLVRANTDVTAISNSTAGSYFAVMNYSASAAPTQHIFNQYNNQDNFAATFGRRDTGLISFDYGGAGIISGTSVPVGASLLQVGIYDGSNASTFLNGAAQGTGTITNGPISNPKALVIGGFGTSNSSGTGTLTGDIAEIVTFNSNLDSFARQRVESYLAIKYGLTLNNGFSDYFSSRFFSNPNSDPYFTPKIFDGGQVGSTRNNVIAIARDDAAGLNQKQSRSANPNTMLTIALGSSVAINNDLNTATFPEDFDFFTASSTNSALDDVSAQVPPGIPAGHLRLERYWQGQTSPGLFGIRSGTATDVTLEFELSAQSGLAITGNASDYRLIIDDDAVANGNTGIGAGGSTDFNFDNANVLTGGTLSGTTLSFTVGANQVADILRGGGSNTFDQATENRPAFTITGPPVPTITSSTYNVNTGVLVVTGTNFLAEAGAANDVDATKFTLTGEGGSFTLTGATADVEIDSATQFTLTLTGADKAAVDSLLDQDGLQSSGGTTYNLAAANDFLRGATGADTADALNDVNVTGNDSIAPTITSIVRQSPMDAATNADTLVWDITFSEAVSNVTADDFDLSNTTATLTVVDQGNNVWRVTATGGNLADRNDTVTLSLDSMQDIADGAGNALSNTQSPATDESSFTVDNTAPIVSEAAAINSPTSDATPNVVLSINEGGTLTLGGSCNSTANGTVVSAGSSVSITLDADGAGGNLADATYSDCTVTVTDAVGNTSAPAAISSFTVDTTGPTVSSVTVPTANTYAEGENLDFTVSFNEGTVVDTTNGTPQIAIDVGGVTRQAVYVSGSGTTDLVFRYVVQAGDNDADGIMVGALSANGGTLRDTQDNDATLTLNNVGDATAVLVDTTAPSGFNVTVDANSDPVDATNDTAFSFTGGGLETTNGTTLSYTITSSNGGTPVTVSGEAINTATQTFSGIDVSGLPDGTLTVSVTLTDAAGNTSTAVTTTVEKGSDVPDAAQSTVAITNNGAIANGTSANQITVTVNDAAGNPLPNTAVTLALANTGNATAGTIPATTGANGQITIPVTSTVAETVTGITYTVNGDTGTGTADLTFVADNANPSAGNVATTVVVDKDSNVEANGTEQVTVTVTLADANGNRITAGGENIVVSATGDAVVSNVTDNGDGTYTATITNNSAETVTVNASIDGTQVTDDATIAFVAGAATQIAVTTQPGNSTGGATLSPVTVQLQDASGNQSFGNTGNVTVTLSGGAPGATLSGTTTVAAVDGVVTFSDLSVDSAGTGYILTFTSGSATGTSNTFDVAVGAATQLVVTQSPSVAFANVPLTDDVIVQVRDAGNNLVDTDNTSTLTIAIDNDPSNGTAQLGGTLTATVVNGVATFSGLTIDTAGAGYTLEVTDNATSLSAATTTTFTVQAEPQLDDSDNDGLPDSLEARTGSDVNSSDSPTLNGDNDADNDGITDAVEAYLEANGGETAPGTTPSTDTDGDGVPDALEVARDTDPFDPNAPTPNGGGDDDMDGIPNGLEDYLETIGGETAPATTNETDTDGDGIPDVIEVRTGTDPTDPNDPSTNGNGDDDMDGIPNGLEDYLETIGGETAPATTTGTDTDGDGIPDVLEVRNGTDPTDPNDPSANGNGDDDNDGIPNGLETYLSEGRGDNPVSNTNTTDMSDSDGDGIPDVVEVANGTDPFDADDPDTGIAEIVAISNDGTPNNLTEQQLTDVGIMMTDTDLLDQYESEIANTLPAPTTTQELQEIIDRVNDSAGILSAILEDSSSNGGDNNTDGLAVTADELQMVIGVDPMTVDTDLEDQYQAAIQAETGFSNPPTAAEVQAIIDSVNALSQVLEDSNSTDGANNADGMAVTINELQSIAGIMSVSTNLESEYQAEIAAEEGFSNPPTLAQVQAIIDRVNQANGDDDGDGVTNDIDTTCPATTMNLAVDSLGCPTVAGIVNASDDPADGGYTLQELTQIGLTNVDDENSTVEDYERAIAAANPAPTTVAELQAIINEVNESNRDPNIQRLRAILEDSASTGGNNNGDGNRVTLADLRAITGLVRIKEGNEAIYQQAIAAETGFSSPPTLAEVQAVIDRNTDTDNDGISDFDEQASNNVDSDGDGIADFEDARDDRDTLKTQVDGAGSLSLTMFLALIALMILHRHKRAGMVVATAAAFAATASAQAGDCLQDKKVCFYVGAGAGISHLSPEDDSNTWEAGDKRDGGFHGLVGLKFHPRWLAELKYADLGEAGLTSDTRTADTNIPLSELYPDIGLEYTATSLMGGFIVNDPAYAVDLILKLGAVTLDNSPVNDRRAGDSQSRIAYEQVEDISVAYGVSLWYGKDDNPIGLRLDFDRYDEDASYLNASIVYSFK